MIIFYSEKCFFIYFIQTMQRNILNFIYECNIYIFFILWLLHHYRIIAQIFMTHLEATAQQCQPLKVETLIPAIDKSFLFHFLYKFAIFFFFLPLYSNISFIHAHSMHALYLYITFVSISGISYRIYIMYYIYYLFLHFSIIYKSR